MAGGDAVLAYFFGRDIFVSYPRKDAEVYATALVAHLRAGKPPRPSCYLDKWEAPPDQGLPWTLKRHLRWSRMLVLIGSPAVNGAYGVHVELGLFETPRCKVIPIDIAGTLALLDRSVQPWTTLRGAIPQPESAAALETGKPSPEVLERILTAVDYTRQETRLKRAVYATTALVVTLIVAAALISGLFLRNAQRAAQQERDARRGRDIALAEQLTIDAENLMLGPEDRFAEGLLTAVQSMRRFLALDQPSPRTDAAMRRAMEMLPRPLASFTLPDAVVQIATTMEGATIFAVWASEDDEGYSRLGASVWRLAAGTTNPKRLVEVSRADGVVISRDGTHYAIADNTRASVMVGSTRDGAIVASLATGAGVREVAFGANGQPVVVGFDDGIVKVWRALNASPIIVDTFKGSAIQALAVEDTMFAAAPRFSPYRAAEWTSPRLWTFDNMRAPRVLRVEGRVIGLTMDGGRLKIAAAVGNRLLAPRQSPRRRLMTPGVKVWSTYNGEEYASLDHLQPVSSVAFKTEIGNSAYSEELIAGSADGKARIWNLREEIKLAVMSHGAPVSAVGGSWDGTRVFTADARGLVRIWEGRGWQNGVRASHGFDRSRGTNGAVFPLMRVTARFCTATRRVCRYSTCMPNDQRALQWSLPARSSIRIFSANGDRVGIQLDNDTLTLYSVPALAPVSPAIRVELVKHGPFIKLPKLSVLSSGGTRLAIVDEHRVTVRDLASETSQTPPVEIRESLVRALAFSPDDASLATMTAEGVTRVWSARGRGIPCRHSSARALDRAPLPSRTVPEACGSPLPAAARSTSSSPRHLKHWRRSAWRICGQSPSIAVTMPLERSRSAHSTGRPPFGASDARERSRASLIQATAHRSF